MKKGIISVLSVGVLVGGGLLGTQVFAADFNQGNDKSKEVNTGSVKSAMKTLTDEEVKKSEEMNKDYMKMEKSDIEMNKEILTDEEAQKRKAEMEDNLNQANVEKLEGAISTTEVK